MNSCVSYCSGCAISLLNKEAESVKSVCCVCMCLGIDARGGTVMVRARRLLPHLSLTITYFCVFISPPPTSRMVYVICTEWTPVGSTPSDPDGRHYWQLQQSLLFICIFNSRIRKRCFQTSKYTYAEVCYFEKLGLFVNSRWRVDISRQSQSVWQFCLQDARETHIIGERFEFQPQWVSACRPWNVFEKHKKIILRVANGYSHARQF